MTALLPASVPPGCTATTASAHSFPLSLSSASPSEAASGRQSPVSTFGSVSRLSVPASVFDLSTPISAKSVTTNLGSPIISFLSSSSTQTVVYTTHPPYPTGGLSILSSFASPTPSILSQFTDIIDLDSRVDSLVTISSPTKHSFGLVFGLDDCQMSQSSQAAAMAAAAGTPPSMRVLSESNGNCLKMTPNPHFSMFAPDSSAHTPLPSSLLASSSSGPVPLMTTSTSSSAASYAAAAAAATAAASATSLPPRSNSLGGPLFASFPPPMQMEKENMMLQEHHRSISGFTVDPIYQTNDISSHFSSSRPHIQHLMHTPEPKRLLDAAQLRDRPTKKPRTDDSPGLSDVDDMADLPSPSSMPLIEDDGRKPPYSYATLIGMSILRSQHRRLTLAQIYKWITDHFSHYRNTESGWQNSIRHNLSLNKAFQKVERPKDDPGKGHYWVIQAGMEHQFLKDRPSRRGTVSDTSAPPNSNFIANSIPGVPTPSHMAPYMSTPQSVMSRPATSGSSVAGGPSSHYIGHGSPSIIASLRGEAGNPSPPIGLLDRPHFTPVSSIQTSMHDTDHQRPTSRPGVDRGIRSSPPPNADISADSNALHSSPPSIGANATSSGDTTRPSSQAGGMPSSLMRPSGPIDHGTPPPIPPFPSFGTFTGDHSAQKDKQRLMDSGYWSSIDSSVRRPANGGAILQSENDLGYERQRIINGSCGDMTKIRGRAEEELARLRTLAPESESPSRSQMGLSRWPVDSILSSPPPRGEGIVDEKTCSAGDLETKRRGHPLKVMRPQASMIDTSCKTPLTPPVMFKRPLPEPTSASPNTNLKNHRESIRQLLGSPDVSLGGIMGDLNGYYDGSIGSSPLKGISPIKFNADEWTVLRTPVPNSHKSTRHRFDDEAAVYGSSPVRNYTDHHEVYLNLATTPKVYTPDSADGSRLGRLLPPPYKSVPSSTLSPEKGFGFPPPFRSPTSAKTGGSNPFLSAPKLGIPRHEFPEPATPDDASPTKSSNAWPSHGRSSSSSRVVSAPLSFPSIKKTQHEHRSSLDHCNVPRTGLENTDRALAEVMGADDRFKVSGIPSVSADRIPAAVLLPAPESDQSSSPRGFDLMKGFVRIGSRTLVNPAGSPSKIDRSRVD